MRKPVVTSVEMGYGHLRAAHALASELGTEILHVDRPPLLTYTGGGAEAPRRGEI